MLENVEIFDLTKCFLVQLFFSTTFLCNLEIIFYSENMKWGIILAKSENNCII